MQLKQQAKAPATGRAIQVRPNQTIQTAGEDYSGPRAVINDKTISGALAEARGYLQDVESNIGMLEAAFFGPPQPGPGNSEPGSLAEFAAELSSRLACLVGATATLRDRYGC